MGYTKCKTCKTKVDRERADNITSKNEGILTGTKAIQAVPSSPGQIAEKTAGPHMNLGGSTKGDKTAGPKVLWPKE